MGDFVEGRKKAAKKGGVARAAPGERVASFAHESRVAAQRSFFGRDAELGSLRAALAEARTSPRIVVVRGAGGIGKSSLARHFAWEAEAKGHAVAWVSGERIAPNPSAFAHEVSPTTGGSLSGLGRGSKVDVLVVDAFERLSSLARWLFDDALEEAGGRLLLVLTTRDRLDPKLSADLRIAPLIREIRLQNLDAGEATRQLAARGVPPSERDGIVRYTGGHPLAAALIADRYREHRDYRFNPAKADDIVTTLAHEFLSHVPSRRHADAIRAACLLHVTDADLLRAILGDEADPSELYEWLRGLSFVESTPSGLVPHALVRDAVYREHSARNPAGLSEFASRATAELLRRIPEHAPTEGHNVAIEALYACRRSRLVRDLEVEAIRRTFIRRATDVDVPYVEELVERFEGASSLATFRRVYASQPQSLFLLCDDQKTPAAVLFLVFITRTTSAERRGDAILERAFTLRRELGAKVEAPDAELGCFRWWFARSSYQDPSPELASMTMAGPFIGFEFFPSLRFILVAVDAPEAWEPRAPAFGMIRDGTWSGTVGERSYGTFYLDVIARTGEERDARSALHRMTAETVRGLALLSEPPPALAPVGVVTDVPGERLCDSETFGELVRSALPIVRRPHDLGRLPIQGALLAAPGGVASPDAFAVAIVDACRELARNAAYSDEVRVLKATYLEPLGKQQTVAAELGLPFGTYRHRLRRAVELLTAELWSREDRARNP